MSNDSGRLDSWKDIAGYLRRDVSTVQRWEKREGMPVHRHVHEKQGSVYAFRSELDEWWRGRGRALEGSSAPTPATNPHEPATGSRRRWLLGGVATILVALSIGLLLRRGSSRDVDIRSLAVLPLDSLSSDPAQDYLADGITDALIAELGKVDGLRVIARSAVVRYRGATDIPSIARDLDVQAVVRGAVQRIGNRISVSATLSGADGDAIWSEQFNRDLPDILTLQREVIVSIAERVRARIPPTVQRRASAPAPVNPDAYDAVLRARYLAVRTTDADNRAAIELAERAIGLDAGFAPAYAELASALVTRLAYVTPDETASLEQRAFAAAEKALSLDPDLPGAYLARGDLLWSASQRFAHERAVQEFRRALALHPNSDEAHRRLARVFVHLGFFEEARQHAMIALAINPSNAQALNSKAQATLWSGGDEEALAMLQSIPGPVLPELVEANTVFALVRLGRRNEAAEQLQRAIARHPSDPSGNLPAVRALLISDTDSQMAETLLRGVMNRKAVNPSHHAAYFAAVAFARLRQAEESVRWLREAAETGFPCYALFARDPLLDPIRKDARYIAFLAEMQKKSDALRVALFQERR